MLTTFSLFLHYLHAPDYLQGGPVFLTVSDKYLVVDGISTEFDRYSSLESSQTGIPLGNATSAAFYTFHKVIGQENGGNSLAGMVPLGAAGLPYISRTHLLDRGTTTEYSVPGVALLGLTIVTDSYLPPNVTFGN